MNYIKLVKTLQTTQQNDPILLVLIDFISVKLSVYKNKISELFITESLNLNPINFIFKFVFINKKKGIIPQTLHINGCLKQV